MTGSKKLFVELTIKTLSFLIALSMLAGVSVNIWHIHEHGDSCAHSECCGHTQQDYTSVTHFDKAPWTEQTHIDCLLCLALKFQYTKALSAAVILFLDHSANFNNSEYYDYFASIFTHSFFGRAPPVI